MKYNIQINSIFNVDKQGHYTNKSLLYQDMICYSIARRLENPNPSIFKQREIANWLLRHNQEPLGEYRSF